jgi:hypothetical protein
MKFYWFRLKWQKFCINTGKKLKKISKNWVNFRYFPLFTFTAHMEYKSQRTRPRTAIKFVWSHFWWNIVTDLHACYISNEGSIGLPSRKMKFFSLILIFSDFLLLNNMIWAINFFSVRHAPLTLQKFVSTLAQSLWKLESWNFGSRSI